MLLLTICWQAPTLPTVHCPPSYSTKTILCIHTQLCRAYRYNTAKYSLLMLLYSLHTAFFPLHDFPINFFCPNSTLPAVCSDIMIMKRKKGQKVQKNTEKRIESIKHWPQYYVFREHRSWRVHWVSGCITIASVLQLCRVNTGSIFVFTHNFFQHRKLVNLNIH